MLGEECVPPRVAISSLLYHRLVYRVIDWRKAVAAPIRTRSARTVAAFLAAAVQHENVANKITHPPICRCALR